MRPEVRTRTKLPVAVIASILAASFVSSETLPPPLIAGEERGAVVARAPDGSVRWRAEWTMRPGEEDGRPVVALTETGEGIYSPFREEVRWELETTWMAGDRFSPLRAEKTFYDLEGNELLTERKRFDWGRSLARFERHIFVDAVPASPVNRDFDIPADTLIPEGIAAALRSLPFEPPRGLEAHFLSNEPKLYRIAFEPRGRQHVNVPAGNLDCYHVELVPDLGFLNLFRAFAPEIHFWLTRKPPHYWTRYRGPESGPGTPTILIELREYEFP